MTGTPFSPGSFKLGLQQLFIGSVLVVLAGLSVWGMLLLPAADRDAGPRPAAPAAEVTPIPAIVWPTATPLTPPAATLSPQVFTADIDIRDRELFPGFP